MSDTRPKSSASIVERLRKSVTKGHEPTDELAIEAAAKTVQLQAALSNCRKLRKAEADENDRLRAIIWRLIKEETCGMSDESVWVDARRALGEKT